MANAKIDVGQDAEWENEKITMPRRAKKISTRDNVDGLLGFAISVHGLLPMPSF